MYRTDDAGESWQRCDDSLPPIVSLMGDPGNPGHLYAQTAEGMFRSTDGAASWQRADRGLPSRFGFALHALGGGAVYTVPLQSQTERHAYGGRLTVYRSLGRRVKLGAPSCTHAGPLLRRGVARRPSE